MKNVTIYTTPTCTFCRMTKDFFAEHGVQYVELDVAQDLAARQTMFDLSHQMGVPVIEIDGQVVVGFNKPKLVELLGIKI